MKYEHKAIISKALANGCSPMEYAPELLAHDLVESMKKIVSGHAVAFRNMSEQQQDSCLAQMQADVKEAVDIAIGVIHAAGSKTVRMKLVKATIGATWQFSGNVASTEEFLHELGNKAQDKSDVLVLIAERDYFQGLDAIRGEKDQKSLPLAEGDEPAPTKEKKPKAAKAATPTKAAAKKVIEIPPKLLDDARTFVTVQQLASIAGLQNHLKIGYEKAVAILDQLAGEGVVVWAGDDVSGQYELVRNKPAADEPKTATEVNDQMTEQKRGLDGKSDGLLDALTDEIYDAIKARVIEKQSVAMISITLAHSVTDEVAEQAIDRLELDGVISEEDDLGGRVVYEQAA